MLEFIILLISEIRKETCDLFSDRFINSAYCIVIHAFLSSADFSPKN